jgi:peptidoglycan/LPS O-acetylase OafA/YrhL
MILNIQFLRALSVLSVIFFHLKLLPGGYLGVDIFFFISGFLMTKISSEYLNKKKYDIFFIKNFFWKRFIRIFPLLLFVIFFCSLIFYFILIPPNLINFAYSSLYSLFFLSNFYFYIDGFRYFAEINSIKPLLHTWSLSVEAFFYLVFPLIFFFHKKKYFLNLIFFLFFVSLFLCIYTSYNHTSINFYFPGTRFWEFLMGSIIFLNQSNLKQFVKNSFCTYISFLLIITCFIFFNENTRHPSFLTLIPLLCSSVIVLSYNKSVIQDLFNLRVFQFIGKISYSLYLNHYVLIVIFNIYLLKLNNIFFFLLFFFLLFIFSVLTYNYVENSFRYKYQIVNIKKFLLIFFLVSIFLNLSFIINKGFPERFKKVYAKDYFAYPWTLLEDSKGKCFSRDTRCEFNNNQRKNIHFIGSSISVGVLSFIKDSNIFKKFNWYVYSLNSKAIKKKDYIKNFIINENNIFVIDTFFLSGIRELDLILDIVKSNKNINLILIYPYLKFPNSINKIIYHNKDGAFFNLQSEINNSKDKFLLKQEYLDTNLKIFQKLDKIKGLNVSRIYPHKIFCDEIICQAVDNENILFVDTIHMSMEGSLRFSNNLLPLLDRY